jgi:hypothetical protein
VGHAASHPPSRGASAGTDGATDLTNGAGAAKDGSGA